MHSVSSSRRPLEHGDLLVEAGGARPVTAAPSRPCWESATTAAWPAPSRISSRLRPDALRHPDEGHPAQHVAVVAPLAAVGAGGGDQALGLVEAQGRMGQPGAGGRLADAQVELECLGHASSEHNNRLTSSELEVLR